MAWCKEEPYPGVGLVFSRNNAYYDINGLELWKLLTFEVILSINAVFPNLCMTSLLHVAFGTFIYESSKSSARNNSTKF